MRKKASVAGALLIAILLLAIVFLTARPLLQQSQFVTSKALSPEQATLATFEISNRTGSPYALQPLEVEALDGREWQRCFFFAEQLSSPSVIYPWREVVAPHGSASRVFELTNLPPEVPLRLRCFILRELTGVPGFWERFQERYHHVGGHVSLNPWDKYTTVFDRNVYQITSDEFIEPKR